MGCGETRWPVCWGNLQLMRRMTFRGWSDEQRGSGASKDYSFVGYKFGDDASGWKVGFAALCNNL